MVNLSKSNTKIGNILNFSFPPIASCKGMAEVCGKTCYAAKAYRQYPNVRKAWDANLIFYHDFPEQFWLSIDEQLSKYKGEYFRWFVSGDIVDWKFFQGMCLIAKRYPNIKFLTFTKQYATVNYFINTFGYPPNNLTVIFSGWPGLPITNPYQLTIAYLRDKEQVEQRIPDYSYRCPGSCVECKHCWHVKLADSLFFMQH